MCCSEAELGISDDDSGLMDIPSNVANGTNIKDVFCVDDIVFEVDNKPLTNRPDLWGHYGIARKFAALAGCQIEPIELADPIYNSDENINVTIGRIDLVYRYSCLRISNINKDTSSMKYENSIVLLRDEIN
jgi:phenylalanyl-tRNA synthetase beta chain